METNHEPIIACVPPVAGSRPVLHVVERVEQRKENPRPVMGAKVYASIGGAENQGMLDALTATRRAAVILAHRGFTVLEGRIGWRNARLSIEAIPRCADLGGTEIKRVVSDDFDERTLCVNIHGVQVEWVVAKARTS
ncbi:hypothetical protein [Nitrosospira sp. Nsp1]|uniref:hypothetical protein n=1 Tax=Nitrosospira sp. Nsp1 TaxID=136547 RepID=UPI000884E41E|nr:hypothetical protein [Nitrosospira sp. Nsp1]SCX40582.1 hypothetical protein SAMN05720354_103135 [Nitrosospira sp. Nsp1]